MASKKKPSAKKKAMSKPAASTLAPAADAFIEVSVATIEGLGHAIRECNWIAQGGDPTSTQSDRDLANLRRAEYENDRVRANQRVLAYLGGKLSIFPPTSGDVTEARQLAGRLAQMVGVNVQVGAVIQTATNLLNLYRKTEGG